MDQTRDPVDQRQGLVCLSLADPRPSLPPSLPLVGCLGPHGEPVEVSVAAERGRGFGWAMWEALVPACPVSRTHQLCLSLAARPDGGH